MLKRQLLILVLNNTISENLNIIMAQGSLRLWNPTDAETVGQPIPRQSSFQSYVCALFGFPNDFCRPCSLAEPGVNETIKALQYTTPKRYLHITARLCLP